MPHAPCDVDHSGCRAPKYLSVGCDYPDHLFILVDVFFHLFFVRRLLSYRKSLK